MAQVRSSLDGNTLSWVKSEIDQTMSQARSALESYVENQDDESQLRFCLNYVHQVFGTLQMVELYGAAMLAEELEAVTRALIDGQVSNKEDTYEAMIRGMMRLPDYLEKLQAGQPDYPIILLPLLNDLRAARGEALLSESSLFSPDLEVDAPIPMEQAEQPIDTLARKLRHAYHLGLLDWFRNRDVESGLKKISAVIEKLRPASNEPDASRMLWAASGVVEALRDKGIEESVAVKSLLGRVDREVKKIIDQGEFALASEPPKDLLKNLLYYVASSSSKGQRVEELKDAFQLANVMPDTETLERARTDLTGPNAELMRTVSTVLLEDMVQVKDSLDVFVRTEDKDLSVLVGLADKLRQMSDTLGMLGYGEQRQSMLEQVETLSSMANGSQDVDQNALMDVAGALISIEAALGEPSAQVAAPEIEGESTTEIQMPSDESLQLRFRDKEQRQLIKQVVDEVKIDLGHIKEAFNDYVRSPKRLDVLQKTPSLLDRIRGSLSMLSLSRASDLIQASASYIQHHILANNARPEPTTLDSLADAISSIEYYLESLTESWGHPTAILDVAEQSLVSLGIDLSGEAPAVSTGPSEAGNDDDRTMLDISGAEVADQAGDDELTMEIAMDATEQELSMPDIEGEATGELDVSDVTFDDDTEASIAPETEGTISQEFNLPAVEESAQAADEEEPPVQEQKQPAMPTPSEPVSRPAMADDLDDEIIEIFLEEAEEEYNNISRLLPKWHNSPEDGESLKELRRSFHTLKGSGRLVGAVDVGEFAWAFENMLNRVIDRSVETTPAMFELLERGRQQLPQLFTLFKTNQKPGQSMFALIEQAEAISQGQEVDLTGIPDIEEDISIPADEENFDLSVPDESQLDIEAPSFAEEAPELELTEEPLAIEEPELSVEGLDIEDTSDVQPGAASAVIQSDGKIDPVLLDIYRKEIDTHLASLRDYLEGWRDNKDRRSNHELIRALHTLKGSSRTARVPPVAEICNVLEDHAKYLHDAGVEVDERLAELLADTGEYIIRVVSVLNEEGLELPDNADLVKRARALYAEIQNEANTLQMRMPSGEDLGLEEVSIETSIEDEQPAQDEISFDQEVNIEAASEEIDLSNIPIEEPVESADYLSEPSIEIAESVPSEEPAPETAAAEFDYDDELLEIFLEEGEEILNETDHTLHDWVGEPNNIEYIKSLQRQLHTLKGGARMAGVSEIGDLSHSIETMLTAIVDGNLDVNDQMLSVLQKSQDRLVGMLEQVRSKQKPTAAASLVAAIDTLAAGGNVDISDISAATPAPDLTPDLSSETVPELIEEPELTSPQLEDEIEIDLTPSTEDLDEVPVFENPAIEAATESADNVVPLEQQTEEAVPAEAEAQQTVTRAPREQVRVRAELLDNLVNFAGEVSIYRSRLEQQTNAFRYNIQELDETISRLREQLRKFEIETEAQIQFRIEETGASHSADFDPLELDRFTQMQTLSRGMLESLNDLDSLRSILANLTRESETLLLQQSRVNTDLQEGLMRTRMVPFSGQTPRLRRIVRQAAEEMGKKVELHLHGVDQELDRTILERVMSPIEHMLRNAVAHGIEKPEKRSAANKSETGNIHLGFAREGSDIVISVSDDGAGINLEAIKAKAIERGVIKPDANPSKDALLDFILESGFSTAEEVTQIAGRGVGMDVVNNEIKQLGGVLDIRTESGQGTVITISMPLSLSVARSLMVNVADETYAIPLMSVETVERVTRDEIIRLQSEDNASYHWLENDYQYIHLGSMMGVSEMQAPPEDQKHLALLLVRSGEHYAAIHVDNLIGSREVVVKPVGAQLSTLRGIAGATIMGDGSVVLILDLGVLIRLATTEHEVIGEQPAIEEPAIQPVAVKKTPTIMVVDDSITVRKVTTRLLERNNFKTVSAKDGVDALAQLQEIKPDVMLLDVEMPRMDGFELATNVRNDEQLKDIPIIMITSRTGQKHRDRAMNIGVNVYMGKPYSEAELLDNIQALMETKH